MSFIGICDSGLGGLTILKALQQAFPNEKFVYFADLKNVPFGEKNADELAEIYQKAMTVLIDAKLIILACNTLSAYQDQYCPPKKALSIIDCLVREIGLQSSSHDTIGILATRFTVDSHIYSQKAKKNNIACTIKEVPAPLLASAIENDAPDLENLLEKYLNDVGEVDKLLLACTHYNILIPKIQQLRPNLEIIDPFQQIISKVSLFSEVKTAKNVLTTYFTSDHNENFQRQSEQILSQKIKWEVI